MVQPGGRCDRTIGSTGAPRPRAEFERLGAARRLGAPLARCGRSDRGLEAEGVGFAPDLAAEA